MLGAIPNLLGAEAGCSMGTRAMSIPGRKIFETDRWETGAFLA
jgi:hypothetical protein